MRLAFLTHEPFYPPSGGGSAEGVYLVREFVRLGHEVHVFCPRLGTPEAVEKEFGIRVHAFRLWRMGRYTSWRTMKYLLYPTFLEWLVVRRARGTALDLVLSQHTIAAVAAGRLKRRQGVPVVMNFLDYLTGFMETWPGWLMPRPLLGRLMRFELALPGRYDADGVLTVSDTLADRFVGAGYPRERVRPIYYGYDAALFPLEESALAARSDDPPMIVMHGSLDHHHLRQILLEAMARVREHRPAALFKFIGQRTGALEQFVRAAQARGLGANVRRTGFVPYRDVVHELERASVGMVPYEESVGTHCAFVAKIVEYLALGLPVVSTRLDSVSRYFRDEPLVRFTDFNGQALGEGILAWLDEPLDRRRALARPASERVRAALDWQVICRHAAEFTEHVLERASGPSSDRDLPATGLGVRER
ncbi:MAG: glycosyltransferase family 4 protein [Verrucomicrobia bacterium]|nr:glycosyltransferase family 4 protein [Verrucomicrobiota bacterium]